MRACEHGGRTTGVSLVSSFFRVCRVSEGLPDPQKKDAWGHMLYWVFIFFISQGFCIGVPSPFIWRLIGTTAKPPHCGGVAWT